MAAETKRSTARGWLACLAASLLAASLTGCSGEGEGGPSGDTLTIQVGLLPVVDVAPLYLGREKGFFAQEKLNIEPRVTAGGNIIPSVVSGDFELGWVNTTSAVIARSKGLPVRMLPRGVRGGLKPEESGAAILVKGDGPVKDAKDLEGRTVGVAALQSVSTLTASAALEKRGLDVSKVKFTEVPFPEAVAAVTSGRVEAAFVAEPFLTLGIRAGHRIISHPLAETAPNFIVASYFTTEKYIADHGDAVARFDRAVKKSFDYAAAHPQEARAVLSSFTEIPPALAATVQLPDFADYSDLSTLELTTELAKKYGYITDRPSVSDLVYKP